MITALILLIISSSRRTDNRHQHRNRNHAFTQASSSDYDYDQPEHRIVNDHQHQDQSHYQHQGQDHDPSPKEDLTEHDHGYGWHKTSTSTSDYGQHMQLYTLLGGLSFASFLATAVILLTRPRPVATAGGRGNTTSILTKTKTTMANYLLNGNRKEDNVAYLKDQVDQSHHLFVKVPKLLHKLSKVLSPLWYVQEMEKREKVENLEKSEETGSDIDFVPLKVIKIPSVEENWRNLHFWRYIFFWHNIYSQKFANK